MHCSRNLVKKPLLHKILDEISQLKKVSETEDLLKKKALEQMSLNLRLFLFVFLLEFLNSARSVEEHLLTCKKRVRSRTNFHFYNRVILAVCPFYRFLREGSRLGQKLKIAGSVPENHFFILWVNTFLHIFYLKGLQK